MILATRKYLSPLAGIPLLIFHEFVTPYKRGFYCNDDSIRYPYLDSTITRHVLIVIGLVVPSVMV